MRILIDECVNPRLRFAFTDFEVQTVAHAGWGGLLDGPLVAKARLVIDVLVTIDKGFEFQQNLAKLKFGIAIVHVHRNTMNCYRPLFAELVYAVQRVKPGEVVHVGT